MFQCVLSQRFSADFEGDPLDYYRNLRVANPSNYLFYDFGDYRIVEPVTEESGIGGER